MPGLGELNVRIGASIKGLTDGLARAEKDLMRTGAKFDRLGNQIGMSLSLPMAGFAAVALKTQAEFGKSMSLIKVQTGASAGEMEELTAQAQKLGSTGVHNVTQVSGAMLDLVRAGITPAEIKAAALAGALTLASAGSIEVSSAADIAANSMAQFGLKASDMPMIADAFAGAANASTASVDTLSEALKQVGPMAVNSGLGLNQTLGVLAMFDQNALKGSDAGTSLKTMLMRLVPSTNEAKDAMAKLGLKFTDAKGAFLPIQDVAEQLKQKLGHLSQEQKTTALTTIFGSDAIRGASVMMKEGAAGMQKYIDETLKQGSAQALANANTEGAAGALLRLQNASISLAQQFGAALEPAVTKIAAGVSVLSGWFTGLSTETKSYLSIVAMAVIAIGPLLKVYGALASNMGLVASGIKSGISLFASFGGPVMTAISAISKLTSVQAALNAVMMLNPIGLVIAAIAAFSAAMYLAYQKSDTFRAGVDMLYNNAMKPAFQFVVTVGKAVYDVLVSFVEAWISVGKSAVSAISSVLGAIGDYLKRIPVVGAAIAFIQTKFSEVFDFIKKIFTHLPAFFAGLSAEAEQFGKGLVGFFKSIAIQAEMVAKRVQLALSFDDVASAALRKEIAALESQKAAIASQGKAFGVAFSEGYTKAMQGAISAKATVAPKVVIADTTFVKEPEKLDVVTSGGNVPSGKESAAPDVAAYAAPIKDMSTVLADMSASMMKADQVAAAFGSTTSANADKARIVRAAYEELLATGISPQATEMEHLVSIYDNLNASIAPLPTALQAVMDKQIALNAVNLESTIPTNIKIAETQKAIAPATGLIADALSTAATAATDYATQGGKSFAEMGKAALKGAADAVRAALMQATATQLAKVLTMLPPPLNIAVAGMAAAGVGVLFNSAMSALKIPAFADGGIVSGPTLGLIGEYGGARTNPEVIAPLDKLRGMIQGATGGNLHVTGHSRISGNDLLVTLNSAQRNGRRAGGVTTL